MVDANSYGLGAVLGLGLIGEDRYAGDFFSLPEELGKKLNGAGMRSSLLRTQRALPKEARLRR